MSRLFVRHNEQGSVSVNSQDEHRILRVIHQSQSGDILSETEIALQPNEGLHIIQLPRPEPEGEPPVIENQDCCGPAPR